MPRLEIECPAELLSTGEPTQTRLRRLAQEAFLVRLYELGEISSGRAAEVLQMSRREFLDLLGRYGISMFDEQVDLEAEARRGRDFKRRELDCLVLNDCISRLKQHGIEYDTVRGAFLEGAPVYPGAGFFREAHIQVAVRNPACILGVFRPNLLI